MDSILKAAGGSLNNKEGESNKFMDSINNVAGGGEKSEQQEDGLDKVRHSSLLRPGDALRY